MVSDRSVETRPRDGSERKEDSPSLEVSLKRVIEKDILSLLDVDLRKRERSGDSSVQEPRRREEEKKASRTHRLIRHRLPQRRDSFPIDRLLEHLGQRLYSLLEIGLVVFEESGFVVLDEAEI